MKLAFSKYHGTGNDFILVDNREGNIRLTRDQIILLCNRHIGIGADGLMFLNAQTGYDFGMSYYNSDGNESTLCGNGGRCITAFANSLGLIKSNARFAAIDGEHYARILGKKGTLTRVKLKMTNVTAPSQSSFVIRHSSFVINTGSPHLVIFVDNLSALDVVAEGRKLRLDPQFGPEGINVDFVQIRENGNLFVRTYERGVENETLSCGTGVTAAAITAPPPSPPQQGRGESGNRSPVTIRHIETPGGLLIVSSRQEGDRFTNIWLEGPAEFVFRGEIKW